MANEKAVDATKRLGNPKAIPWKEMPPGITARLRFVEGPEKGREVSLDAPVSRLGREEGNTIVLIDEGASAFHAVICFMRTMEWRLVDNDSTNGTLLNGARVGEYTLRNGDKILIGDSLLVFEND